MCTRGERMIHEPLEELVDEIDIELTDQRASKGNIELEAGAAREIDHHPRQRFVERHVGMTVPAHTALVPDCAGDRLPERDADILHRVVGINVQIAGGLDLEIDQAMAGDLVEHVIEETDPGR